MENASKALIMAAGVLIGLLILSLGVYLAITFGGYSAEVQKQNSKKVLDEFNSKFFVYNNREDITIYDIVTVAGYAKDNNKYYDLEIADANKSNYYIKVTVNNVNYENIDDYSKLIKKDTDAISGNDYELPKYKCEVKVSNVTGRVYEVKFSK